MEEFMNKSESAELILRLYETRREPLMREARDWILGFFPNSAEDIMQAMISPETSGLLRMVISYWDMAAAFVNHGAIDETLFDETHGEHIMVFSKIEPYLEEVRTTFGNPKFLLNLERLVMRQPNAKELLAGRREMMKRMMDARAQMVKNN
jgi:hypothetical protein